MLELEQVRGAETRNVPSTSHVGATALEMGTEVLGVDTGRGSRRTGAFPASCKAAMRNSSLLQGHATTGQDVLN